MAAKKSTAVAPRAKATSNSFMVVKEEVTQTMSESLAKLATTSALTALTLKNYAGGGDALEVSDLVSEMKKAGDEVVAGDLGRVERMLAYQLLALDALFNNLGQRAFKQETYKGIETITRLALKAQAQARSTAEALALMKNPTPFIKQANIAQGHQQINNTYSSGAALADAQRKGFPEQYARTRAHARDESESAPNKLLEAEHDQRLDTRAQGATSRADQRMETVGAVHRTKDRGRQGSGGS